MAVRFNAHADRLQLASVMGGASYSFGFHARMQADRNYWSTFLSLNQGTTLSHTLMTDGDGTTVQMWSYNGTGNGLFPGSPPQFSSSFLYIQVSVSAARIPTIFWKVPGAGSISSIVGNALGSITPSDLWIAANPYFTDEWLNGDIGGLKLWDSETTSTEANLESEKFNPVKTSNVWAWFRFDSTSNMLLDKSGNGRNLTNPGGAGSWTVEADPSGVTEDSSSGTSGTVSATLEPVTGAGAGRQVHQGTLAGTLANISAVGAGLQVHTGVVSGALANLTAAGTGRQVHVGQVSAELAPITAMASGTGVTAVQGIVAAQLEPVTAAASGRQFHTGIGLAALGDVGAQGRGASVVTGQVLASLADVTALARELALQRIASYDLAGTGATRAVIPRVDRATAAVPAGGTRAWAVAERAGRFTSAVPANAGAAHSEDV